MPRISFFKPNKAPIPLPDTITREYIQGPDGGKLELLVAAPKSSTSPRKPPIFFAHGGCGCALVWVEFLEYFSQEHNIPCYAVSVRGRGQSWDPGFMRLYFTTKRSIADDYAAGIKYAQQKESEINGTDTEVVLVGHSSGGGLSQFLLSEGDISVRGLALVGSIPGTGSVWAYWNWVTEDPWFLPRMFFHLGHPMSPLSSTKLVKKAFFCKEFPLDRVAKFEEQMPPYESYLWPLGMTWKFVNTANVLRRIHGWGTGVRMLVMAASKDALTSADIKERLAVTYRNDYKSLVKEGKIQAKIDQNEVVYKNKERWGDNESNGVRFAVVEGSGHHLQNDLQWRTAAKKLLDFYEQL